MQGWNRSVPGHGIDSARFRTVSLIILTQQGGGRFRDVLFLLTPDDKDGRR